MNQDKEIGELKDKVKTLENKLFERKRVYGLLKHQHQLQKHRDDVFNILESRKNKLNANYRYQIKYLNGIPNKRKEISLVKIKSRIAEIVFIKKHLKQKKE